ncbi:MAG TPA: hypothetical protein VD816_15005 [Ohtaekwangia sp.]|nr:hypothetical protein [Ohtaekwangia sp.]
MKTGLTAIFLISFATVQGQFLSQDVPATPTLFTMAKTDLNERDMAISPDGTEMFYTLMGNKNTLSVIFHRNYLAKEKRWSDPAVARFSGKFSDLEPAFTSDGRKIYFSSNRPATGETPKDYDIWYVEKVNGKWSEPNNAGSVINTTADEFYPSPARSGNLYFTAAYSRGVGKEDIYIAVSSKGNFEQPVPLDTAINTKFWEFNAFVSPDERFILFTSYGRSDDQGGGDLYISLKNASGVWQPARPLAAINSTALDYCPFVSFDGKVLFFTSARHNISQSVSIPRTYNDIMTVMRGPLNGLDNIYWTDFEKVLEDFR